jgi:hypothetical protein
MYGTRVQRWLLAWGMVDGIPLPETSFSVVSIHSDMSARVLLGASGIRTTDGLPWCDEGWGCNDAR